MLPPAPTETQEVGRSGFFPRAPRPPSFGLADTARAARLHEKAVAELESGRYARASVRAARASELLDAFGGILPLDRAEVLLTLARSLLAEGRLEEATQACRAALALLARKRGEGERRARCHLTVVLAQIANQQGRYADARRMLLDAQRRASRSFAKADPIFIALSNDLGVVCKWAGRLEEAARHYRDARRRLAARFGNDDPAMASLYHNLGGLDYARGRHRVGIAWARRGLAIRERALGGDHPAVGADCAALAALVQASGDLTQAEQLYRRALAIFERGRANPSEAAAVLANVAALCYCREDFREAERYCRRAFHIQQRQLGPTHPSTATTLGNWAAIAARRGAVERAIFLNSQALTILEKAVGASHPTVQAYRDNRARFAALRREMGKRRVGRVRNGALATAV